MKLDLEFYQRERVQSIAKELLGKVLFTRIGNQLTGGIIVETEAYSYRERGCHAFDNLRTTRTEVMFKTGGHAYVYLCYGIHEMFNIVTNKQDKPEAILIRALQPMEGISTMMSRMNVQRLFKLTSGPGKLTRAMGINRSLNGTLLTDKRIWVEDNGTKIASKQIMATCRIGIDYAGEDAKLPWRFYIKGNEWISRP